METTNVIHFFALNIAAAASSLLIVSWLNGYQVRSFLKVLLSVWILFCSQIIIVEIVLGSFGVLSLTSISVAMYGIFLGSILFFGKNFLKNFRLEKSAEGYPSLLWVLVFFGPILLLLFVKAFNAALEIPIEYDSVAYHLPMMSKWLQTGNLLDVYYTAFVGPVSYYPSNYELLDLWTVLPLRNDIFFNLINFPLFAILAVTLWGILRNFGVDKMTALISTAIPFYMPIFLRQAGVPLVDLFFVLAFAVSIYFLQEISMRQGKDKGYSDFFLFGLALGLFVGTKYLGLLYGAVLGLLFLMVLFYHGFKKNTKLLRAITITLLGIILTGSFFYVRNAINSGNPIFPVDVHVFGTQILEGYQGAGVNESLRDTSLLVNLDSLPGIREKIVAAFYIIGPYGLVPIVLPLLMVIFLAINSCYKKLKGVVISRTEVVEALALGIGMLIYFYLYIKAPYTYRDFTFNLRYAMPLLLLGALGIGYMVQKIRFLKYPFYLVSIMVFIGSLYFLILKSPEHIAVTDRLFFNFSIPWAYQEELWSNIIGILAAVLAVSIIFLNRNGRIFKCLAIGLCLFVFICSRINFLAFASLEREVHREEWARDGLEASNTQPLSDLVEAAEWFNDNAPQAKIAYTGFNYHYHLYGREFAREVDYVNINECTTCQYVDYKNSEQSIRRDPDFNNWFENLRKMEKEYLAVDPVSTSNVRSFEFEWAEAHPEHFKRTFQEGNIHIFEISYR